MLMPQRIQRKRTRGRRMPKGAVYVGRPTKWGNPFSVGMLTDRVMFTPVRGGGSPSVIEVRVLSPLEAVETYSRWLNGTPFLTDALRPPHDEIRTELGGRDRCCWCPLGQPCHCDPLMEIANPKDHVA